MRTLRATGAALSALTLAIVAFPGELTSQAGRADSVAPLTLTYLGAAGWEITDGTKIVLVDPYLSRNAYPALPTDTLVPDEDVLKALVPRADYILVHHAHPDHVADVPFLALRTGATVIGTASTANLMRAYGLPARQIVQVIGGENIELDGVSVRVIPALHGIYNSPTFLSDSLSRPVRIWSLQAYGGSLMYQVRIGGREVLTMGSMGYIERELEGLRPDIAVLGAGRARRLFHDYTARLLEVLGNPAIVFPTHWDNFYYPFGYAQPALQRTNVEAFKGEVLAAAPETHVIIPEPLVSITVGAHGEITRERIKPRVEDWVVPTFPADAALFGSFDHGEVDRTFGSGWSTYADSVFAGHSVARLRVVPGGAEGTAGSLLVNGDVAPTSRGNSFAGVMFNPWEKPRRVADFSAYRELSFWAMGDGRSYDVQVSALDPGDPNPKTMTFEAGPQWRHYTFPFSSFGEGKKAILGIAFLSTESDRPFWFQIDEVRVR